jgi:hypothetical protein
MKKYAPIGEKKPSQKLHKSKIIRICDFCKEEIKIGELWRLCGTKKQWKICAKCDEQ